MRHHVPSPSQDDASEDLCVSRVPLFQGLTHGQQLEVAEVARALHLGQGQQIYAAGSDVSQLLVVHRGRVKITRNSADGHEQIVRILGPGDFVGENAFLTGGRPDHAATAIDDAELCVFHHADLGELLQRHASIGLRMLQGVSVRLEQAEARLSAVVSGDVSSRVADYLLSLPGRTGPDGQIEVVLPLRKKDVASLLDTTPESLSRQLRALSEAGMIAQGSGRRITILDFDALGRLAD